MPTLKLNARAVPTLKPRADGGREVYRDTVVRGLYVEAHPTGRRVFGVWFRINGRASRLTLGPYQEGVFELADARDAARDALHSARKGIDPAAAKRQRRDAADFGTLIETFLSGIKGDVRPTSWDGFACLLRHKRLAKLRSMKTDDISRGDVVRLVDKIALTAPYSANRTLEAIRRVFTWAVGRDIVQHTPCVGIAKPTREKPRQRSYTDDEMRSILAALDGDESAMGRACRLCAFTGVRINQALGAPWSEFDLDKAEWRIAGERVGSKNALDWLVPLTSPAVELLTRLKADADGPWVFPIRVRKDTSEGHARRSSRATYAVRKVSGVADFRPHDLRRTLTSWLAAQQVPKEVRDAVIGHKPPRLEGTYNVYAYGKEKRKALDRWARHLDRIASERPVEKVVTFGAPS